MTSRTAHDRRWPRILAALLLAGALTACSDKGGNGKVDGVDGNQNDQKHNPVEDPHG